MRIVKKVNSAVSIQVLNFSDFEIENNWNSA
jgi:hypothetical protein